MAEPTVNTTTLEGIAAASATPVATEATNAEVAAGLSAATAINLGIGEALLNDPIYGEELRKVFKLYKTNKTAAIDALFKTKFAKLDTDARQRYVTPEIQSHEGLLVPILKLLHLLYLCTANDCLDEVLYVGRTGSYC